MKKLIFIFIISIFLYGGYSSALSCILPSLGNDLRASDNIYIAYINNVDVKKNDNISGKSLYNDRNTIRRTRISTITPLVNIKGSKKLYEPFNYIYNDRGDSICHVYSFVMGQKWLIFESNGYFLSSGNKVSYFLEKYGIYLKIYLGSISFLVITILIYILIKLSCYLKSQKNINI